MGLKNLPKLCFSVLLMLLGGACKKVPLTDINAGFTLADATWFEEEETLFVFYRVGAEQGLGPASQLELTYRTDDLFQNWAPLASFTPVHLHLPVDCSANGRCGSLSLHVAKAPRDVGLQLRYNRDGALTLPATVAVNLVHAEAGTHHRSLGVYGVFDATNTQLQWRTRHQFPTLRNEQVTDLGLRRYFQIADAAYGDFDLPGADNPYSYAFAATCPAGLAALSFAPLETLDRAFFDGTDRLPVSASTAHYVCATSTVKDAKGTFLAPAVAQKNPQVAPAFPVLRSPIKNNTELGFILRPCNRTLSDEHLSLQEQRLQLSGAQTVCIDNWQDPGFAATLASTLQTAVDVARTAGHDLVLGMALHHDDPSGGLEATIEAALEPVLVPERDKSSPRVSGAFVFDSYGYALTVPALRNLVLWCPANSFTTDLDKIPDTAELQCPLIPDIPDLVLGPFKVNQLPILPTRDQYLKFVSKYTEAEVGAVKSLTFLAPERTPISDNVPVGDFGFASFFNDETISAAPGDVFSFCNGGDKGSENIVFHVAGLHTPHLLSDLPKIQATSPLAPYYLGIAWGFPFLTRISYENVVAGSATAFSFSVPFGFKSTQKLSFGATVWGAAEFPLSHTLLQCTRFCDHPTFDSDGVYNVRSPFRTTYQNRCYTPAYPTASEGGFPRDP